MYLKSLKTLILPIYSKIFHHRKSVQTGIPPAACPFTGRPAGKEFSRYEDVKAILADDQSFHTSPCYDGVDPHHILLSAGGEPHDVMAKRLREFIATHKAGLEKQIVEIATNLLHSIPRHEPFDFRVLYCDAMAFRVMGAFYGLTDGELQGMADQVGILPHDDGFKVRLQPYMTQLLAKEERTEPGLLASVQRWQKDGVIEKEEALFLLTLLWFAGIDTSTIALGRMMEFLLKNPHLWQELKGNSKNQLKFIEEVLRLKPPTTFIQRSVVKDSQIGDQTMQAGERIWLNILAANRDPEKFNQPNQLDLNGNNSKHLVFGYGMHQCIGMSLVRWEAKALLQVVLPLIETFQHLSDSELTVYGEPVEVNPITYLQVRFSPYAGSCPYHQEKKLVQVSSFQTADQILRSNDQFSTTRVYEDSDPHFTLLSAQGERHKRHTQIVLQSLNAIRHRLKMALQSDIRSILSSLPVNQPFDFRKTVAEKITFNAVCEIFGYTHQDMENQLQIPGDNHNHPDYLERLRAFFIDGLTDRQERKKGMLSDLKQEIKNKLLTPEEAAYILQLIWRGGQDSLSVMLCRLCQYLVQNKEKLPLLIDSASARVKFVEESIRLSTPTAAIFRETVVDNELNGRFFQKGQWVRLDLGKANRDPMQFDDPNEIQFDGSPRALLSFGKGPHQCIGMSMSRMEMRILLDELLPLIPHMQLLELEEKLYYGVEADLQAVTRIMVQLEQNPLA